MYLSLPLQSTTTRTMTVTVFSCDGSALPSTCTVTVPKQGRCRDLIQVLSNASSVKHGEKLLLVEVSSILHLELMLLCFMNLHGWLTFSICGSQIRNHMIQRFLEDPLISLSTIKDDDHLAAYKVPKLPNKTKYLQLIHRRREQYVYFDLHLIFCRVFRIM